MTRLAPLVLALVLAACDAEAPLTPAASDTSAPVALASLSSADAPFAITEDAAVRTSGGTVLLRVNGQTLEMDAGQAYLIGEALTRASYDVLPRGLQSALAPRRPGDKCEPPPPGGLVTAIGGTLYTRCPPPPPPPFSFETYNELLGGAAEIVEAPEGIEWVRTPGGFLASQ